MISGSMDIPYPMPEPSASTQTLTSTLRDLKYPIPNLSPDPPTPTPNPSPQTLNAGPTVFRCVEVLSQTSSSCTWKLGAPGKGGLSVPGYAARVAILGNIPNSYELKSKLLISPSQPYTTPLYSPLYSPFKEFRLQLIYESGRQ